MTFSVAVLVTVAFTGGFTQDAGGPRPIPPVVAEVGLQDPPVQMPPNQQPPNQRGRGANQPGGIPMHQLQTMFDAFVLVEARKFLQLNDDQYQRFFTRMSRIQDLRRTHGQTRMRLLNELRRMYGPQNADEATLTAKVKEIEDLELKFMADMKAARAGIDEILTPRQRAGFRFFEEDMERQKIDFITRARQGGGGMIPGPGGPGVS